MSKRIPVGPFPHYYAIVDDEDYDRLSVFTWCADVRNKTVYASRSRGRTPKGETRYMHKLITGFSQTDHANKIGLDNRRQNLRETNHTQNLANSTRTGGSSKFKGVYFWKRTETETNVWKARIQLQGKQIYIGTFDDEAMAARAYDVKAKELFGEFARLNFKEGE